jgi:hypothetical protein
MQGRRLDGVGPADNTIVETFHAMVLYSSENVKVQSKRFTNKPWPA